MIASNKEKEAWIGKMVTLNGKPARIMGRKLTYPHVATLDMTRDVVFSWQAVKRIILNNNGNFTS